MYTKHRYHHDGYKVGLNVVILLGGSPDRRATHAIARHKLRVLLFKQVTININLTPQDTPVPIYSFGSNLPYFLDNKKILKIRMAVSI